MKIFAIIGVLYCIIFLGWDVYVLSLSFMGFVITTLDIQILLVNMPIVIAFALINAIFTTDRTPRPSSLSVPLSPDVKICANCEQKIKITAKFCDSCGVPQ